MPTENYPAKKEKKKGGAHLLAGEVREEVARELEVEEPRLERWGLSLEEEPRLETEERWGLADLMVNQKYTQN